MKNSERFRKSLRLTRRVEFLQVQNHGVKISVGTFLALATRNSVGNTRLGLTVSRKVGGAVLRNRVRRRMREVFRRNRAVFPAGLDVVLIARSALAEQDFASLTRAVQKIGEKLGQVFP